MKGTRGGGQPVPRRLRGRRRHLRAAELGRLRDRVRAHRGRIRAVEHGRIDPAPGVGLRNERNPSLGLSPGGSPAPLPVLRAPAVDAMRRSGPRRRATGPVQMQRTKELQRSNRARHGVSAGRGIRAGRDRRQAVLLAAVTRLRNQSFAGSLSVEPSARLRPASGGQGRSGPPSRGGQQSGPKPARSGAARSGAPRPSFPRSDNPRPGNVGRPFPRPSRPGARPGGPRPPSTGGAGQDARPRPNPRGPGSERPRSTGYARTDGKPRPGGAGKGRSDRGPRPPFVPGSRPAKSWPRSGGPSAKPGKPSFRGRKPDRKKPGA